MTTNVTSAAPLRTPHINVFVNPSSLGSNTVVAAPSGVARIRVLQVACVTTLANNVNFLSAATSISATFPLAANGGVVLPYNEHGWFETNAGEALNVNLSVGTATAVQIQYIVLPS